MPHDTELTLTGSMDFEDKNSMCEERPVASIHFFIPGMAFSALKLSSLTLSSMVDGSTPNYKMYKGVKMLSRSGDYEIRF